VKASTAILLIVICLAAVGGVGYGSYRSSTQADRLEQRVAALERSSETDQQRLDGIAADRDRLCASVNLVRQKITGVVLAPGSPTPNFDIQADPLSAPERTILMLYNWCHASR
jgi:hypothetical protein